MLAAVILIKSYKHIYTASQAKSCINLYSQAMIGQVGKSCLRPMKSIASHSESTLGITIFQVFKNNVELFFKVTTFHYFQPEFKFKKKKKMIVCISIYKTSAQHKFVLSHFYLRCINAKCGVYVIKTKRFA